MIESRRETSRAPSNRERWILVITLLVLAAGLTFHFAATLIAVFPPNPAGTRAAPFIRSYLHPYFAQSWRLFAPDPGARSSVLLVKCRSAVPGSEPAESPWIDVTTPLLARVYENRLHPALTFVRLNKAVQGSAFGFRDAFIEHLRSKSEDKSGTDTEALRKLVEQLDEQNRGRPEELTTRAAPLHRLASAYCASFPRKGSLLQVKARFDLVDAPPFSRRQESAPASVQSIELDWAPAQAVPALRL